MTVRIKARKEINNKKAMFQRNESANESNEL